MHFLRRHYPDQVQGTGGRPICLCISAGNGSQRPCGGVFCDIIIVPSANSSVKELPSLSPFDFKQNQPLFVQVFQLLL